MATIKGTGELTFGNALGGSTKLVLTNDTVGDHVITIPKKTMTLAGTDDAVLKSGSIMTGAITALRETKVAMGANDIDLSAGNLFTKTISGATTLTVSNWLASGNANSFILELTNGGSAVITWFAGVKWASGTAPTLTASGVDILGFYSHDGGTTVRGMVLSKDSK